MTVERLYKYGRMNAYSESLFSSSTWQAAAASLNDPFECTPSFVVTHDHDKIMAQPVRTLQRNDPNLTHDSAVAEVTAIYLQGRHRSRFPEIPETAMQRMVSVFVFLSIAFAPVYVKANDEWSRYMNDMRNTPVSERARIASVPESPPRTQAQVDALKEHKKLLLKDLQEVENDILKGKFPPGSNALFQAEGAIRSKSEQIDRHLVQSSGRLTPAQNKKPPQFQGRWTTEIARCDPNKDDEWVLILDADSISYYGYSSTALVKVTAHDPTLMVVEARYFGENQEWTDTTRFKLYDGGTAIGILGPEARDFKRIRCP